MSVALIISIAILVEALVEYGKSIGNAFESHEYKTAITQILTMILGIVLAFAFKINIFAVLGIEVSAAVGIILTGIIISRGSNYASDLIGRLNGDTMLGLIEEVESSEDMQK